MLSETGTCKALRCQPAAQILQIATAVASVPPQSEHTALAGRVAHSSHHPPVGMPHHVHGGKTGNPLLICSAWMSQAKSALSSGLAIRSAVDARAELAMGHSGGIVASGDPWMSVVIAAIEGAWERGDPRGPPLTRTVLGQNGYG